MADLKALFGKKQNAVAPPAEPTDSPQPQPIQGAAPTATPTTPKPTNPFARNGSVGSSNPFGRPGAGTPANGNDAGGDSKPESKIGDALSSARASGSGGNPGSVDAAPITSLESLDATEDEGIAPRGTGVSYFADETPATKPTRELPEGLSKESLGFLDTLDTVYNVIHDPEILGSVITNIMVELKSNPEYARLIAPEDVRVMVRGMRESMGLARVKKQETKAKRSGGGKRGSKICRCGYAGRSGFTRYQPMKQTIRLSYSSLNVFSSCARKWEFDKLYPKPARVFEDNYAADVGTALHAGYQHYLATHDRDESVWAFMRGFSFCRRVESRERLPFLGGCAGNPRRNVRLSQDAGI
jgi:hypothetical protein